LSVNIIEFKPLANDIEYNIGNCPLLSFCLQHLNG